MMNITIELVEKLLAKHGRSLESCAGEYSESGYDDNDKAILFANWNDVPNHVVSAIEKQFEIEWSDEWTTCHSCNGAVRTSPDSHGWTPSYTIMNDCELLCGECIKDNCSTEYLEEIINNSSKCNLFLDLEELGFEEIECGFESGWHPGQNSNPEKILAAAQAKMPEYDFIFGDLSTSQFTTSFCLYRRLKVDSEVA